MRGGAVGNLWYLAGNRRRFYTGAPKMTETVHRTGGIAKYIVTYFCILAIAAVQFVVAYSNITPGRMLVRMMILASVEAALAILFFMHLWTENHGLLWFVLVFTIFVLVSMQFSWTDSFRVLHGVAGAR
jgi:heme/copper-type cytochrome/quinol oxidase subunit 4